MRKFLHSFIYAWADIRYCISRQQNFRFHCWAMLAVILMGVALQISVNEWWVVILCCAMVLAMEMLNTAVEKLCDMVHPSFNTQIKAIKDVAAGAVLVVAIAAAVCGAIIFLPKLYQFVF